jgi:hypothetical protein
MDTTALIRKALLPAIAILSFITILSPTLYAQDNKQPGIKITIADQPDCQVLITGPVIAGDMNTPAIQYRFKNSGSKAVLSFVVQLMRDGRGAGLTDAQVFTGRLFQPGSVQTAIINIQPIDISRVGNITLSVDYIQFSDGSFWGPDTDRNESFFQGMEAGRHASIKEMTDMASNNEWSRITHLLETPLADAEITVYDTLRPERWQQGYRIGYKSVVVSVAAIRVQGAEKIAATLESME